MNLTYEKYAEPRNELVIEAIKNSDFIDGDIWRMFLDTCKAIQIVAAGFGGITTDNLSRKEIDKWYIFNVYGIDYQIWSYINMENLEETFPAQVAQKVISKTQTVECWEIEEEE